jgi:anti-sigma factor RsiW
VEVPGEQEQHLVSWLTKRMGVQLRVPQLASLGFHLVGGRLLSSDDGPGALLMYEDGQGRRVILYACHNEKEDRSTAFRFAQEEGISVFHWLEGPLSYALAGEIERTALLAIAEAVYQQISV